MDANSCILIGNAHCAAGIITNSEKCFAMRWRAIKSPQVWQGIGAGGLLSEWQGFDDDVCLLSSLQSLRLRLQGIFLRISQTESVF